MTAPTSRLRTGTTLGHRGTRGPRTAVRGATVMLASVAVLTLLLVGCVAGPNTAVEEGAHVAGFWLGLWHGFIVPVTFVVSLFNDAVSIYEIHNNGGWYDFGFLMGVSAFFSGGGAGARGRSRSSRQRR